jgi:hypothetical protein
VRPRLVVVGAEGVIDDGHGHMRPGAASAIRAASSHGCAVVLATDRTSVAARELLRDPLLHPIAIVSNGAVLWNAREASAAYVERIEQTTLAAVVLAVRSVAQRSVLVFEGDDWLASDTDIPPSVGLLTLRLERGELPPKPTARLHILDVPEAVAAVRTALEFPLWRERRIALFQRGGSRIGQFAAGHQPDHLGETDATDQVLDRVAAKADRPWRHVDDVGRPPGLRGQFVPLAHRRHTSLSLRAPVYPNRAVLSWAWDRKGRGLPWRPLPPCHQPE